MAYIGRLVNYGNAVTQQLTGNNGASYVLLYDTTTDSVVISLDGVVQVNGTDFNITGTALVFTSSVATGIQINVIYTGLTIAVGVPADNTITNAKLLNMNNLLGQIKKGFYADIIATNDSPTEDISTLKNIIFVMKDGEVYKK